MQNPKMQSLFLCKGGTSQYGAAIFRVSCITVYGRLWKFSEFRIYLSPWDRLYTKPISISKGSYGNVEPQNAILVSVQRRYLPLSGSKLSCFIYRRIQGRQWKFSEVLDYLATWYGLPLRQYLYQLEATGMQNPKMQSLFRYRGGTSQYVAANFPVSCIAVQGRQWKFSEVRGYLASWYRACTRSISI